MEELIARVYAAYKTNGIPTHDKAGVSLIGRLLNGLSAADLVRLAEYWEAKVAKPAGTLEQLGAALRRIAGLNGPNPARKAQLQHALAYHGSGGPWRDEA